MREVKSKRNKSENKENRNIKRSSPVKDAFKFLGIVFLILIVGLGALGGYVFYDQYYAVGHNKNVVENGKNNLSEAELEHQKAVNEVENAVNKAVEEANKTPEEKLKESNVFGEIADKTFFGIYGVDQDERLSDVIIVACFDKNTRKITALSIPRDTYITLSDSLYSEMRSEGHYSTPKTMKINAVHSWGEDDGDKYLTEELEEMLGIPQISYYITVNVEAFQKIVDDIGGITIDVPQNMDYDDAQQGLFIHLKQGVQKLDGYNAMCLVRYRHYTNGDVDRVQVQQQFLHTLLEQALSTENIVKNINSYAETFLTYVKTNMTVADALKYTPFFPVLKGESLTMATLPGGLRAGDSGYFIDSARTKQLVDILFYDGEGDISSLSGLSWGNATDDSAEAVAEHEERELDEADNGNALDTSIDYDDLTEFNDKDKYMERLDNIIEDYPEPENETKEVIAKYIEFAAFSYCNRAFYVNDNTAVINGETIQGLGDEVNAFAKEMTDRLSNAPTGEISLNRDILTSARVDVSGVDFSNKINIKIEESTLNELENTNELLILLGDNLNVIKIRTDDLKKLVERYGGINISFEKDQAAGNAYYNIQFADSGGNKTETLNVPVYFGFFTDFTEPSCFSTTDEGVENIGGRYDGKNKILIFAALKSGDYDIQDVETSYDELSGFASAKRARLTTFLTRGFMPDRDVDIDGFMTVGEFKAVVGNMLREDVSDIFNKLEMTDDEEELTYGELLATAGEILNRYKHNKYPENVNDYLAIYSIADNKDSYDKAVALAISCDLVSRRSEPILCSEPVEQGDILNVLSNLYNLTEVTSAGEYRFVTSVEENETDETSGAVESLGIKTMAFGILRRYVYFIIGGVILIIICMIITIIISNKSKRKIGKKRGRGKRAKYYEDYDEYYYDDYDDEDYPFDDDEDYDEEYESDPEGYDEEEYYEDLDEEEPEEEPEEEQEEGFEEEPYEESEEDPEEDFEEESVEDDGEEEYFEDEEDLFKGDINFYDKEQ